jgi:hypothetical protein
VMASPRDKTRAKDRRTAPPPDPRLYFLADIVDAPEHHNYARAMGLLTWGTWDAEVRPLEERLKDFLQAYPAEAPAKFQGSMLSKSPDGEYGPAPEQARLRRIEALDGSFGTIAEALARYGLKRLTGSEYVLREVDIAPFREVKRARNQRLRFLHGRVDIEADNMDEAKAAELERLEKKQLAAEVRRARAEMRREADEAH